MVLPDERANPFGMEIFMRARIVTLLVAAAMAARAWATPSTQIWIPSTDVQKFGTVHLNYDVYAWPATPVTLDLGPTVGLLPWNRLQAEAGFDIVLTGDPKTDAWPLYFNLKIGTPEGSFARWMPALAAGIYDVGIKPGLTTQNVVYGLVARTLPVVGRLSLGYYFGNPSLLVDRAGRAANRGLLASWDRTLTELTDKLWVAIDYQGGQSALGALSGAFAWYFTPDIGLLAGYDWYLSPQMAGRRSSVTLQLDITVGSGSGAGETGG